MTFPRRVRLVPVQAQPLGGRDDDTLMTLSQAGSRDAFAVLVERHALRVVRTCFRFTGDSEQAQELAQGIWVSVWESRLRYRPGTDFLIWLVTVARNHCRNELRRQRIVDRHAQAVSPMGEDPSPAQIDSILAEERRRRVHQTLCQLPEVMREALLMRYGEELRYDEMSTILGAQESTLRSRVHNGLKLLKLRLEKIL
jgi:RNA polymerase sigma-70 factor (ECF subfamily)